MPDIARRPLGRTGLKVSVLGMGLSRIGSILAAVGKAEAERAIVRAAERGITLFDTADIYGQGDSERVLGRALRPVRASVVIATKGGFLLPRTGRKALLLKPLVRAAARLSPQVRSALANRRARPYDHDFSPAHIAGAVEASLKRLGTDYIDLYQLHSPPAPEMVEPALEVLLRLREQGKIRAFGAACEELADVAPWAAADAADVVQLPGAALGTPTLAQTLATLDGWGVIARQPFSGGTWMALAQKGEPPNAEAAALRRLLAEMGLSPLGAALAWVRDHAGVSTVLPGMTSTAHVEELADAIQTRALSPDEISAITRQAQAAQAALHGRGA
ncbi:aldo/keto reductase [Zavarzinia sp. CC-PAN008]|uniref:aldo/keto reductase n=1 Tax=Zavarzinia sp. CC-PAN008 TaxID=3243332 RepID=UPI003F74AAB0